MHIVHIATELAPIAKVGGLGDVIYGLSKELVKQGHHVEILLPKYDCLQTELLSPIHIEYEGLWSFDHSPPTKHIIWSTTLDTLPILLIDPLIKENFFCRGVIYGCHDDIDRFTYFSRAALEYLFQTNKRPDIIHVHDWPAAIVPACYQKLYAPLGYQVGGTVLTIHNLEHQGRCSSFHLSRLGLENPKDPISEKMRNPHLLDQVNLLEMGIEYADQITTVSPRYTQEIQTPEGGCGLHELLQQKNDKLSGILNGIDENFWNPAKDSYLTRQYPTGKIKQKELATVLEGKQKNKTALRDQLNLGKSTAPLVACITRLVPQKSPHLIQHALFRSLELGAQFVLLGSSPILEIHEAFSNIQKEQKENLNLAILLHKDERLAHQIFAAADMLIIPSLFEPCGLTQLIALRYGTVPIVRATGGLIDTVFDIDTSLAPLSKRNGFTFEFPDPTGVNWALDRAISCYEKDPRKWDQLILNGMRMNFTWESAATDYLNLYKKVVDSRVGISS